MKAIPLDRLIPVFQLHYCASRDEHRFVMMNVRFNPKEGKAVATDGHKLVQVQLFDWKEPEGLSGPEFVLIPKEACKFAMKIKGKEIAAWAVSIEDGKITFTEPGAMTSFALGEGAFPDTDSIWPKAKTPYASIGLNAAYLLDMAKAMKNWGYGEPIVKLDVFGPMDAIRVHVGDGEGLLMPCRVDGAHVDSAPKEFANELFDEFPGLFGSDDEVNGADLVDWITQRAAVDRRLQESLCLIADDAVISLPTNSGPPQF